VAEIFAATSRTSCCPWRQGGICQSRFRKLQQEIIPLMVKWHQFMQARFPTVRSISPKKWKTLIRSSILYSEWVLHSMSTPVHVMDERRLYLFGQGNPRISSDPARRGLRFFNCCYALYVHIGFCHGSCMMPLGLLEHTSAQNVL